MWDLEPMWETLEMLRVRSGAACLGEKPPRMEGVKQLQGGLTTSQSVAQGKPLLSICSSISYKARDWVWLTFQTLAVPAMPTYPPSIKLPIPWSANIFPWRAICKCLLLCRPDSLCHNLLSQPCHTKAAINYMQANGKGCGPTWLHSQK